MTGRPNITFDRRHGRYRVRKAVNGREYNRTFTRPEDAEEYVRTLERRAAGLEPLPVTATLAEAEAAYLAKLRERGCSSETLRFYGPKFDALRTAFGAGQDLSRLDDAAISAYLKLRRVGEEGKKKVRSNRTLRAELALLHRVSRLVKVRPTWDIPDLVVPNQPRRYVPPEELAHLWVALADRSPAKIALGLCALGSLRASEAFRATAAHVASDRTVLALAGPERKTGQPHTIPLVRTLTAQLPARGALVGAVHHEVAYVLKRTSRRLGLPAWTGPGLGRHVFASWAVKYAGYTSGQVAEALGHARPGAVRFYVHGEAVESLLRPMAEQVERVLLEAIAALDTGAEVLPFRVEVRR
jgi:integrase